MEINGQRSTAIRLATEAGAQRTLALLKSDQYRDVSEVLKTAAGEVGLDKLVPAIINFYPAWAGEALRFLPDLGSYRQSLIDTLPRDQKANGHVNFAAAAVSDETVSVKSLTLYLAPGAAMEAWFTMFWMHQGVIYPQAVAPDLGQWDWSIELSIAINRSYTMSCSDFAAPSANRNFPGAPLAPGDVVWMVERSCSTDFDTGFRFVYQPNGTDIQIDVVGAALSPSFSIHQPS
jgi:hypothetical protein